VSDGIDVETLADWQAKGRLHTVIDVREEWELDICRLPGALHIPLSTLMDAPPGLPQDRPLVLMCHHGLRSARAVSWLRSTGFRQAINLEGGIDAWARRIDPTVNVY